MSKATLPTSAKAIYKQLELLAERRLEIMREENQLKKQLIKLSHPLPVHKGKILFKNSRATILDVVQKKFAKRASFSAFDVFQAIRKHYPVEDGSKEYKRLHSNVCKTMTEISRAGHIEVIDGTSPRSYRVPHQ